MTVYLADPDVTLYHGDALETLRGLPDESVHCVVTSPPYWGLRDYGTGLWAGGDPDCDHNRKTARNDSDRLDEGLAGGHGGGTTVPTTIQFADVCGKCGAHRTDNQLGLEPTPELYVQNMVTVFREVRRVLRRDGTCWLNIGDSYASGGTGGAPSDKSTLSDHGSDGRSPYLDALGESKPRPLPPGLKPKDLCLIPAHLAIALQQDGWWLRADIIWAKPNPMPESVTDRPTKAHEYVFMLTRSPRYFFDQEAVREKATDSNGSRYAAQIRHGTTRSGQTVPGATLDESPYVGQSKHRGLQGVGTTFASDDPAGRNVRSVWEIATEPFPAAHFATFPTELARRCILAGTSERGCCPECGAPWERVVETNNPSKYAADEDARGWANTHSKTGNPQSSKSLHRNPGGVYSSAVTLGWRPTCDCSDEVWTDRFDPVPCTVLDPFAGACTVPHVARKHGRHSIGIELSETYLREIALPRLQQLSLLA